MPKQVFLALFISVLAACDKKDANESSASPAKPPAPACDSSRGSVVKLLAQSEKTLLPGLYRFERGDYLHRIHGENVLIRESYAIDEVGDALYASTMVCPEQGKLTKTGGMMSLEYSSPNAMLINAKGDLKLPDTYDVLRHRVEVENNRARFVPRELKVANASKDGVEKDATRKVPNVKITPVKDGLVISKNDSNLEYHAFFRLVRSMHAPSDVGPKVQAQPSSQAAEPQQAQLPQSFTKEQCLEQRRVQLGGHAKHLIKFSADCSMLFVVGGLPKAKVTAAAVIGTGDVRTCGESVTSRALLHFESGELDLLRKLQKLNPDIYMNVQTKPATGQTRISYLRQSGESRLTISEPGVTNDAKDPNRLLINFRGSIAGVAELDSKATCKYFTEIQDYKAHKQQLTELLINEFAIEMENVP